MRNNGGERRNHLPAIHHSASEGYAAKSDTYVAGRPDYPPQAVGWLRSELGLGEGKVALDLGAGSEIPAVLRATGASVVAVEPVPAMLAQLVARSPEVNARAGTAEHIPLDDASVDAVVCAQAFHWFANSRALGEIRRIREAGAACSG